MILILEKIKNNTNRWVYFIESKFVCIQSNNGSLVHLLQNEMAS